MKKITVLSLFVLISITYIGCKQDATVDPPIEPPVTGPTKIFSKTIGTGVSELTTGIVQADDGGVVVCGYTIASAFGDNDMFVTKIDGSGNVVWSNLYGGPGNDQALSIEKTADGGYIIGGTATFNTGFDPISIKLDGSGNVQWSKYYAFWNEEHGNYITQTSDGGYIMTGYTNSAGSGEFDIFSLKLDAGGSIMWGGLYGGAFSEYGNSIRPTGDGGYVIGGYTYSFGQFGDGIVIKIYGDGVYAWSRIYGGTGFDNIKDLQIASNGVIACGSTVSFGLATEDAYVFNLDNSGFVYWCKTFGGNVPNVDLFTHVKQTTDGGFIACGFMQNTTDNAVDMCLVKLYGDGAFNWMKLFGGVGSDNGTALFTKSDGGYLLGGVTASFGAGANDIYIQSLRGDGTGCSTDNPVTPVAGQPTLEVNTPNVIYFNMPAYNTVAAPLQTAPFSLVQNTQCMDSVDSKIDSKVVESKVVDSKVDGKVVQSK